MQQLLSTYHKLNCAQRYPNRAARMQPPVWDMHQSSFTMKLAQNIREKSAKYLHPKHADIKTKPSKQLELLPPLSPRNSYYYQTLSDFI